MIKEIQYNGLIFQVDTENMNRRFKGGSPKTPPPPEVVTEVEDMANTEVKRQKRRSVLEQGKQSTMIAGVQSMLDTRMKKFLGE
jgi:hypothetical protein